jgi:hypothetical protein
MKAAKLFCIVCTLFAAGAAVSAQASPALYSFEDMVRLAVAAPVAPDAAPAPDAAIRLGAAGDAAIVPAAVQDPAGAELHFVVEPLPAPRAWLLLLAGIAAAGWVAHRRLAQL